MYCAPRASTSLGSRHWRPACSLLTSVPLEIQRRIVNDAIKNGATSTIVWLAVAYAGVALLEQALKLALNVYRGWVSEDAVRTLRRTLREAGLHEPAHRDVGREAKSEANQDDDSETGTHAAMVVSEAEPIGGFVGMAISEPLLQIGILVSVIGYMTSLERWALALSAAFLLPQVLFVPALQQRHQPARRRARPTTLRQVGGDIVDQGRAGRKNGIERVFELNMGIYKIKYSHEPGDELHVLRGGRGGAGRRRLVGRRSTARGRHGGGDGLGPRQAQRPVGRPRELGPRALGQFGQVPPVRRCAWAASGALQPPESAQY